MRCAVLLVLVAAAAVGCRSEGVATLSFSLGGDVPQDLDGLFFHTQVRDQSGTLLGGAVVEASRTASIQLSVAHGEGRVARLEIRDGASAETSAVIAYGVSKPFDLLAGRTIAVEVAIPLRRVPRVTSLSIANASGGAIATSLATVHVEVDRPGVVEAVVAQDPSLTFRRARAALEPSALVHEATYDLELDCERTGGCGDGPRAVFVRLVDDAGYTSSSTSTTLVLDTEPPAVLGGSASVAYEAPGALVVPTAAGDGTTVRLTFTFNEVVTSTPTVRLADSDLPFTYVDSEFGAWIFERTIDERDPPGLQRPLVTGIDRAGNAAPFASPALEYLVDDVPPEPPDVDDPDRIVYERAPWGTYDRASPIYVVRGAPGTVEPGTRVVVYDDARALEGGVERANRAGVGVALEDGSFEAALTPFDRPAVYLLLVDPSGNLHAPDGTAARVRNTVLTVPAVTSGVGPPTEIRRMDRLPPSLRTDAAGAVVETTPAGLLAEDGEGPTAEYVLRWTQLAPAPSPLPDQVRLAASAYDAARARTVVFGGRFGAEPRAQTWEWDGARWMTFAATGTEPVCNDGSVGGEEPFGHAAYHGGLRRTVVVCRRLVPDQAPPLPPGDVDTLAAYGWNGERWSTLPIAPGSTPPSRSGHALAYDASSGAIVMFGGNESSLAAGGQFGTNFDDTWALEVATTTAGPSLQWNERVVANPPPARDRHAMVEAPGLGVVMFGGIASDRDRTPLDDLWVWNGQTWNEVPRTTPWPPARACHTMVYDPESGAVGVIGGVASEPVQRCLAEPGLDDVWWWDGNGWTEMAPGVGVPSGTGIVAATHRALEDVIVLGGGGLTGLPAPSRTWRVSTQRWIERTPTDARVSVVSGNSYPEAAMVYDEALDRTLVHTSFVPAANVSETWTWDDGGWRLLGVEPTIGSPLKMVYDPVRRETVMLAAIGGLFRQYAHDGDVWREVDPGAVGPPVIGRGAAVFDTDRQEVVVLAAQATTATVAIGGGLWGWNGSTWQSFWMGEAPTAGGLVYEPTPNRYVTSVFQANPAQLSLYVYQAGAWSSVPYVAPWSVEGMGFRDALRDKTYQTGFVGPAADLWELVGAAYEPRETTGARPGYPTPLANPAYDRRRHRAVAPILSPVRPSPGNVDVLDLDPDNRPAVVVRVDLARAGIQGRVIGVDVTASAGGRGFEIVGGDAQDGAELVAWDHRRGAWRALGSNAAPTMAPTRFSASASMEDAVALVPGYEPTLDFAVRSAAGLGAGHRPSVRLDRLAARIAYRAP